MSWKEDWQYADAKRWKKHFEESFDRLRSEHGLQPIPAGGQLQLDPVETQLHARLKEVDGKMIEVGCGAGHLTIALLSGGRDICACDISEKAIKHAKQHIAGQFKDKFFQSPVEQLGGRKGSYDTVIAHNLIPQVRDPKKALEVLWALVKDGGSLVLTAPVSNRLGDDPDQIHEYSQDGFRRLVEEVTGRVRNKHTALAGRVSLLICVKEEIALRYTQVGMHLDDCRAAMSSMETEALKTGFWNWQRVFQGDMQTYKQLDYAELDCVHVQLAGATMNAVRRIHNEKPDHVQVVAQIDYSVETWNNLGQDLELVMDNLALADHIIAVEPRSAQLLHHLTGRPVHLLPHPVPVDLIKQIQVQEAARFGLLISTHRDGDWSTPYWVAREYPETYLSGWEGEETSSNFVALTRLYYDEVLPICSGDEHVRFMALRWAVFEAYRHSVFSRVSAEAAALGVPCVGYDCCWGMKYLFPHLTVPVGDLMGIREKLAWIADPVAYSKVSQYAQHMVQTLDLEWAGNRFLNMLNGVENEPIGDLDVYPGLVFSEETEAARREAGSEMVSDPRAVGRPSAHTQIESPV